MPKLSVSVKLTLKFSVWNDATGGPRARPRPGELYAGPWS